MRLPDHTRVWVRGFGRIRPAVVVLDDGNAMVMVRDDSGHLRAVDRGKLTIRCGPTAPTDPERAPDYSAPELEPQPKPSTWRSPKYLEHVRSLPCAACGAPPRSEASHHGPRGTAIKASDALTIPLCWRCHREHHAGRGPTEEQITEAQRDTLLAYVEG